MLFRSDRQPAALAQQLHRGQARLGSQRGQAQQAGLAAQAGRRTGRGRRTRRRSTQPAWGARGSRRTSDRPVDHARVELEARERAGAAAVELRHKHRGIFFTGDVLFTDQRTVPGAKFPAGHFDTIVTETTRGDTERSPDRTRATEMTRLVSLPR